MTSLVSVRALGVTVRVSGGGHRVCIRISNEYGLTRIDATQSIGEQQRIMRQMIDQTLADYQPPSEAVEREYA